MTSTPSPASQSSGKCVVCGEETWMRCSACAENGLEWMRFCSIEHQKLIWFMHKKVCGTRAVPFIWPGFSSYEIEDIWSFASKPYRSTGTSKPTSFQESAGRRLSPLIKEVMPDYALEVLLDACSVLVQEQDRSGLPKIEGVICIVRGLAHKARIHYPMYSKPENSLSSCVADATERAPFDALASRLSTLLGELALDPQNPKAPPWVSQLLHLEVILFATKYRHSTRSGSTVKSTSGHVLHASRMVRSFCQDVVARTHPREAQLLIDDLEIDSLGDCSIPSEI